MKDKKEKMIVTKEKKEDVMERKKKKEKAESVWRKIRK